MNRQGYTLFLYIRIFRFESESGLVFVFMFDLLSLCRRGAVTLALTGCCVSMIDLLSLRDVVHELLEIGNVFASYVVDSTSLYSVHYLFFVVIVARIEFEIAALVVVVRTRA